MPYSPSTVPAGDNPEVVMKWLQDELAKIAENINFPSSSQYQELNEAPTKPRTGQIVLADGTNWNPGSGQGFYGYYGGAWHKLG